MGIGIVTAENTISCYYRLCTTPHAFETTYLRWKRLLNAIMIIVVPDEDSIIKDECEAGEDVPEAIAYDATYSKLYFATNQVGFGYGPVRLVVYKFSRNHFLRYLPPKSQTTTQDLLSSLSVDSDPKTFLVQKLCPYQQALGPGIFFSALQEALTLKQLSMLQLIFRECSANLQ